MAKMVASILITGRTDSRLRAVTRGAERDISRVGKTAVGKSRVVAAAVRREGLAAASSARSTQRLARATKTAATGAGRMATSMGKVARQMKKVGVMSRGINKTLDTFGNKWAGIAGAVGIGAAAKNVMDLGRRMTRLGIQANVSDKEVKALKQDIFDTAMAPDIRIDPSQILGAIEQIVEKTGDLEFARNNIRNIGLAIQATGGQGIDVGGLMGEFQKMGIKDPKKALAAMDTLNLQGKMGAFTLSNLARLGPRVITAYTSAGREGTDALREMGAALQMIRMGTGSSEMGATAFEALIRSLTDPTKIKQLKAIGIEIFDPEKLAEGKRVLRPINDLMAEIIQTVGGDKVALGSVFDAEAVRAFNQAAGEFLRTGQLGSLDKFMAVQGDGTATLEDSARVAKDATAALTSLYTVFQKFADDELAGPIQAAADAINSIGTERAGQVMKTIAVGGLGIGALIAGRKVYRAGSTVHGWMNRRRAGVGGVLGGKGLGSAGAIIGGATPVQVVNWPGGLRGPGIMGRSTGRVVNRHSKSAVAGAARAGGIGRLAGRIFRPLGMLTGALDLFGGLRSGNRARIGASAGGLAGGGLGTVIGATLGSVVPVFGTIVGGMLGGTLFSWLGEKAGAAVAEASAAKPVPAPAAVNFNPTINVTVNGDGQGARDLAQRIAQEVRRQLAEAASQSGALYDGGGA